MHSSEEKINIYRLQDRQGNVQNILANFLDA
jgi:hypothetical protein